MHVIVVASYSMMRMSRKQLKVWRCAEALWWAMLALVSSIELESMNSSCLMKSSCMRQLFEPFGAVISSGVNTWKEGTALQVNFIDVPHAATETSTND